MGFNNYISHTLWRHHLQSMSGNLLCFVASQKMWAPAFIASFIGRHQRGLKSQSAYSKTKVIKEFCVLEWNRKGPESLPTQFLRRQIFFRPWLWRTYATAVIASSKKFAKCSWQITMECDVFDTSDNWRFIAIWIIPLTHEIKLDPL